MNSKKHLRKNIIISIFAVFILIIFTSTSFATETVNLNSKAAILVDNDSGKILYGKNENEKVYPASTTKVLTAILALEKLDLTSSVVVSKEAVNLPYGSSNAALKQGEVISVKDLLYGLMLRSGNDCANVLAEAVSGSIDNFVELMNDKLKQLGCTNSHFANAHGYHDDNHYTTPSDMMKILSYAIKNDNFVKIISTTLYTIEKTNKTDSKRIYQNTNRLILTKDDSYLSRYYEYCIGGKTGYTDEAGRTLVAYAKNGEKNLLIGIFNAPVLGSKDLRYTDAITLFDYGFNNFEKIKLIDKKDYVFSYTNNEKKLVYTYSLPNDIYALSLSGDNTPLNITYDINLNYDELNKYNDTSTHFENQAIGTITMNFTQNNSTFSNSFDLTLNNVALCKQLSSDTYKSIKIITICIVSIFVLFVLLKLSTRLGKRKKSTKSISTNGRKKNTNYVSRRIQK